MVNISLTKAQLRAILALSDAFLEDARAEPKHSPIRLMLPTLSDAVNELRTKVLRAIG